MVAASRPNAEVGVLNLTPGNIFGVFYLLGDMNPCLLDELDAVVRTIAVSTASARMYGVPLGASTPSGCRALLVATEPTKDRVPNGLIGDS